jgi:hypothetical protein
VFRDRPGFGSGRGDKGIGMIEEEDWDLHGVPWV